jgi:hypothetical protein
MIFMAEEQMEQVITAVEENIEVVQDKQELIELSHDILDRIGGGIVSMYL